MLFSDDYAACISDSFLCYGMLMLVFNFVVKLDNLLLPVLVLKKAKKNTQYTFGSFKILCSITRCSCVRKIR